MLLSFFSLASSLSRGIPHLEPFGYLGLLTSSFYNLKIKSHLFPVTVTVKYVNKEPWFLFQKLHWNHWSVQTSTSCQWTFSKLSFVPKHLQWSRSIYWSQRQNQWIYTPIYWTEIKCGESCIKGRSRRWRSPWYEKTSCNRLFKLLLQNFITRWLWSKFYSNLHFSKPSGT